MDIPQIIEKINETLIKYSDIKREIKSEDDLREDLHLDSLDTVEIILQFEKEFNIHIDDDKARNMIKVEDVYRLIKQEVANRDTNKI